MTRRRRAPLLVAGLLLVSIGGLDLYARWPAELGAIPLPVIPEGTETLVLIFHGKDGREEPTLKGLEGRLRELAAGESGTAVIRYDWSPHSDNRFRAGANGLRVGAELGAWAGDLPSLKHLHLVAHSAGAYVLDPLCEQYREVAGARSPRGSAPARVVMTFLDPIGIAGAVDFGWGARHFGRCADFAEAYVNTDDPAPGTRQPLAEAWTVDVTDAPGARDYPGGGHRWPVQFYLDQVQAGHLAARARNHADEPRGSVAVP